MSPVPLNFVLVDNGGSRWPDPFLVLLWNPNRHFFTGDNRFRWCHLDTSTSDRSVRCPTIDDLPSKMEKNRLFIVDRHGGGTQEIT